MYSILPGTSKVTNLCFSWQTVVLLVASTSWSCSCCCRLMPCFARCGHRCCVGARQPDGNITASWRHHSRSILCEAWMPYCMIDIPRDSDEWLITILIVALNILNTELDFYYDVLYIFRYFISHTILYLNIPYSVLKAI